MHVLIIEDDIKIANYLKVSFNDNDVMVDIADEGIKGLNKALSKKYDFIILDIAVPGISGKEICSELRSSNNLAPILILTAQHSTESKLELFKVGADDYITKPFNFEELFARAKATMRRSSIVTTQAIIEIADLVIDIDKKSVKRAGKTIKLTRLEFNLLTLLAQNRGRVLSRTQILRNICNDSIDLLSTTVDVHISMLRSKMDKGFDSKLIHTVQGFGYKLEIDSID